MGLFNRKKHYEQLERECRDKALQEIKDSKTVNREKIEQALKDEEDNYTNFFGKIFGNHLGDKLLKYPRIYRGTLMDSYDSFNRISLLIIVFPVICILGR